SETTQPAPSRWQTPRVVPRGTRCEASDDGRLLCLLLPRFLVTCCCSFSVAVPILVPRCSSLQEGTTPCPPSSQPLRATPSRHRQARSSPSRSLVRPRSST